MADYFELDPETEELMRERDSAESMLRSIEGEIDTSLEKNFKVRCVGYRSQFIKFNDDGCKKLFNAKDVDLIQDMYYIRPYG